MIMPRLLFGLLLIVTATPLIQAQQDGCATQDLLQNCLNTDPGFLQ
ncbi:MAG: hypothetical protein AAF433_06050 [Bacteroidota bacterium]